ncbi:MAG: SusD/RagB family nutrient-binding outer membrane lipoprotein [Prevotellaceae bacterium]|nr:SusD/RagB family nutrient-binding outer membrane lipoprotein [Prevotellaceae bacterium]
MKTYYFKITAGLVAGLSLLLVTACTARFEEYNTHPTEPSPDNMSTASKVGALFSPMLYLMHNYQENDNQMIEQMVGNQYGGYMVTTSAWNSTNFGTLNPQVDWVDDSFDILFTKFYGNYFKVKETTEGQGPIFAWANIVRVAVMLRVTDTYGPIPYTKMGGGNMMVGYDDVQTVYHAMIDDLNVSVAALTGFDDEDGKAYAEYDIVYGGKFSKWVKFANSLKLRMAVRIAAVDTDYAKSVMKSAIEGGCIESNGDNALLPTTDNPYLKASISWTDLAINATLSSYMLGYSDPRCPVYMTKTLDNACPYRGVRMGIDAVEEAIHGSETMYSKPNFAANSPLPVFCAAETHFLKAEAALQGWITDDPKSLYESGITISMQQHGVPLGNYLTSTATPADYTAADGDSLTKLDHTTFTPVTIKWDDGVGSNLEKIITQKWIANYPIGMEAWSDFRRTGFPQLLPAQDNLSSDGYIGEINNNPHNPQQPHASRLVRRLPFPQSEYERNSANVQAAEALLGGEDKGSTDLWWAKK